MKIVDLVTPSRGNDANASAMVASGGAMITSPLQSQSVTAINDLGGSTKEMVDVDFSPKVSPLRRHEADHQMQMTPMGDEQHAIVAANSALLL